MGAPCWFSGGRAGGRPWVTQQSTVCSQSDSDWTWVTAASQCGLQSLCSPPCSTPQHCAPFLVGQRRLRPGALGRTMASGQVRVSYSSWLLNLGHTSTWEHEAGGLARDRSSLCTFCGSQSTLLLLGVQLGGWNAEMHGVLVLPYCSVLFFPGGGPWQHPEPPHPSCASVCDEGRPLIPLRGLSC